MKNLQSQSEFDQILQNSHNNQVLLCKFSPICPTSLMAQREVEEFLQTRELENWSIDVIKSRALSRSIAEQIKVRHESPQAFIIKNEKVMWHGSHYDLTREKIAQKWLEAESSEL